MTQINRFVFLCARPCFICCHLVLGYLSDSEREKNSKVLDSTSLYHFRMHHPYNKWRGHKPAAHIRNLSGPEPLAHEENQNVDGTVQHRTLQSQTILCMNQRGLYPKCASKVRAPLSDSHWSLPRPWLSGRKNTSCKHTMAVWAVYRTLTRPAAASLLQHRGWLARRFWALGVHVLLILPLGFLQFPPTVQKQPHRVDWRL